MASVITGQIAVGNLATAEKYFDHFVVEMHLNTTGSTRVASMEPVGIWNTSTLHFEQQKIQYFNNCIVGTTYQLRCAVADKYGNLSAWSAWIATTVGSTTPPGQTFTPVATPTAGGIRLTSVPGGTIATDTDHYEMWWSFFAFGPTSTTIPNLPDSPLGIAMIHLTGTESVNVWIRAVNTTGIKQTWVSLGTFSNGTLDNVNDGTTYGKVNNTAIAVGGFIDPSAPGVISKGNRVNIGAGTLSFSTTTTSITFTWTSLVLLRDDGTSTSVPNGSQAITGLTSSHTYGFYPYWDEVSTTLKFATAGTSTGSPAYAYAAGMDLLGLQEQSLSSHAALSSGAITVATPSSGTGGGTGGGSRCPRGTMSVHEKTHGVIQVKYLRVGQQLKSPTGWETITDIVPVMTHEFVRVHLSNGQSIDTSPTHLWPTQDGLVRAKSLTLNHILEGSFSEAITINAVECVDEIDLAYGLNVEPTHLFFIGETLPTVLTHNFVPIK